MKAGKIILVFISLSLLLDGSLMQTASAEDEAAKLTVINVSYDKGILRGVELFDITAAELEDNLSEISPGADSKVFIWDSLKGLKPYREPMLAEDDPELMTAIWNGRNVTLTKNPLTGETEVWQTLIGDQRVRLHADAFAYDDTGYEYGGKLNINCIAVYKNRLYAGCDGGRVIVFTECSKCYQLRKLCDFDIKSMEITNGIMTISDGISETTIDMSDIGGDSIEANEALELYSKGARLIDVRTAEEFAQKSYAGSVNIPLSELEAALGGYEADDVLIFYCASGGRSAQAVAAAKALGFANVYNLGSIDKLI